MANDRSSGEDARGDRLAEFRRRLNMIRVGEAGNPKKKRTLGEIASEAGLPRRSVENYLKDQKPGFEAIIALAQGLGVSAGWLMADEGTGGGTETEQRILRAAFRALQEYTRSLLERHRSGVEVFADGKILGRDPDDFAAEMAANVGHKYYLLVSLEREAKTDQERA